MNAVIYVPFPHTEGQYFHIQKSQFVCDGMEGWTDGQHVGAQHDSRSELCLTKVAPKIIQMIL